VIIGGGRTGSGHLVRTLNRHPEILCHSEAFHRNRPHILIPESCDDEASRAALYKELVVLRRRDPLAFLERIYGLDKRQPIVGFKIFERHNQAVLDHLLAEASIRKVVLFRANTLARYASLRAAYETNEWQTGSDRPVRFVESDYVQMHEEYMSFIDQTYSELNNATVMAALFRFLGASVPVSPTADDWRPRAAPDILSRFSNPDEAEAFLRSRGLMHLAYEGDVLFSTLVPAV
jgi:hypothetical protein